MPRLMRACAWNGGLQIVLGITPPEHSAVMPRESGAFSIPERSEINRYVPAYWIVRWRLSSDSRSETRWRTMTDAKNSVMVPRHDKSAFLHDRPRRLHSHQGCERTVGSQFAARPGHHRPAGLRDRTAPRQR